jgi:hypothetical protein
VTGREALLLALEGLVAMVRAEHPSERSLAEIAESGPIGVTPMHVAAIAALEAFGGEFLACRPDEVVPEIGEVEIA